MSEPVQIRVTGETRYLTESEEWECSGYGGGGPGEAIEVRVTGATEDDAKAAFITEWNERAGTSWTDDQFAFTRNEG